MVEWAEKLDRLRTVAHSRHDLPWREVVEAVRTTDWDEAFACSPSECVDIALGLGAVRRDDDVKVLHALADTLTEDLKAAVRLRIARSKQTYMGMLLQPTVTPAQRFTLPALPTHSKLVHLQNPDTIS